jgi:xanthine dehydrogenase iron-sulfur cluster and FAD-binding subunit A
MAALELLFALNGEKVSLPAGQVDPSVTLNDFIRRQTKFSGTKLSCGEGGCGACAVDIARTDPITGEVVHMSVNSCLRPLASMDGWSVTTTEGLGGPKAGYHPIQQRLADFNGLVPLRT